MQSVVELVTAGCHQRHDEDGERDDDDEAIGEDYPVADGAPLPEQDQAETNACPHAFHHVLAQADWPVEELRPRRMDLTRSALRELLGLTWSAVDLVGQRIEVVSQAVYVPSDPRKRWIDELKTTSSRRVIRIDGRIAQVLREHKARQDRQRLLVGSAWIDNGLVFTDDIGDILPGPVVCGPRFHEYAKAAGVHDIRPHDMRHTAATIALRRGVTAKEVAEMLGHASVRMTLDRYTHLLPDIQRVASNRIADALFG